MCSVMAMAERSRKVREEKLVRKVGKGEEKELKLRSRYWRVLKEAEQLRGMEALMEPVNRLWLRSK